MDKNKNPMIDQMLKLAEVADVLTKKQAKEFVTLLIELSVKNKQELSQMVKDSTDAITAGTYKKLQDALFTISQKHADALLEVRQLNNKQKKTNEEIMAKVQLALDEIAQIEVKDGKDADEEMIIEEVLKKIPKVELDDREKIVSKINKGGKEKIDASQIKNLPNSVNTIVREGFNVGGFETPIKTSTGTPLAKDASGAWILPASSGGGTWGSITGTLSDQTDLQSALDAKQATLVSGTNIKTINGTSLLGSGDVSISGVGTATANEIAYWDTTTSISSLDTATYPSLTELSYVKGVTSAIQTQLNGKATTALDNLASVAINTSLISDTNNTDDLGSSLLTWRGGYFGTLVRAPMLYGGDMSSTYAGYTGAVMGGSATHGVLDFVDNNSRIGEFYTTSSAFNFFTDVSKDLNFYTNSNFTAALSVLANGTLNAPRTLATGLTAPTTTGTTKMVITDANGLLSFADIPSGGSGATTALDNLASVAINTTLVSDTDNTDSLGTSALGWSDLYLGNGGVIEWSSAASTPDITLTHSSNLLTMTGGVFKVSGDFSGGVTLFERTNASTNAVLGTMKVKATSTGDMTDGFGSAFQFYIQDTAAVENYLGDIRMYRDGADDSGSMSFSTTLAGVTAQAMVIDTAQNLILNGDLGLTGSRVNKGWFTDLTVTNAIAASITGSAPTLTTPRAIYGNNFDGSAALTQIIASTYGGTGNGFTKFSGATTAEKTYTLPDASTTILTKNYTGALATGIVKNTTTTGELSIAVAGDFPTLNQNTTGSAATLTTTRTIWGQNFNGSANVTGSLTAVTNITGGASSMTIQSGTGASRTLTFKTTTSGSTATTAIIYDAVQRGIMGNSASLSIGGNDNKFQIYGTDIPTSSMTQGAFSATAGNGADFRFYRSKNAAVGSATVVASGDNLGTITWYGAQQTGTFATQNPAAQIIAEVDGTVTSGAGADMPGRIVFKTTPDGSGTLAEVLRLDNAKLATFSGNIALGANSLTMTGSIAATGARVTKGWFTDIESTNVPTVGGSPLSSTIITSGRGYSVFADHATTTYSDTEGNDSASATETNVGNIVPFSGTIRNLYIDVNTNTLDSGSVVFTLMKNGVATSLTLTVSFGVVSITGDTSHTVTVTAGDRISIRAACTGTSGGVYYSMSYLITM